MRYNKKILVIAAHMDDEVLGCGGVILSHKEKKDRVWVIFVARRIYNHHFDAKQNSLERSCALKAKLCLGYDKAIFLDLKDERLDVSIQDIIIPLEKYIYVIRPEVVYVPFRGDNNQDHRAVFDAARVALRPLAATFIKEVNMYEVSSVTEQSPPLLENAFLPNFYVDIKKHISMKIKALSCYKREKRVFPHPRSPQAVKVLSRRRGIEIGYEYAEAFMNLRRKFE